MTKQPDIPAFPRPYGSYSSIGPGEYNYPQTGMSLRDYFAAKAMQALIASRSTDCENGFYDEGTVAISAYAMADAMLRPDIRGE